MHTQEQATICTRTLSQHYISTQCDFSLAPPSLFSYLELQTDGSRSIWFSSTQNFVSCYSNAAKTISALLLLHLKQFIHSGTDIKH